MTSTVANKAEFWHNKVPKPFGNYMSKPWSANSNTEIRDCIKSFRNNRELPKVVFIWCPVTDSMPGIVLSRLNCAHSFQAIKSNHFDLKSKTEEWFDFVLKRPEASPRNHLLPVLMLVRLLQVTARSPHRFVWIAGMGLIMIQLPSPAGVRDFRFFISFSFHHHPGY